MRFATMFLILSAAAPTLGRELITRAKTPVYEKPDKNSAVLIELEPHVLLTSDEAKDFWFRVSVEVAGKQVSGWVNQTDVSDTMGRAKGELLAENKQLLGEVTELRKKTKTLEQQLDDLDQKLKRANESKLALQGELATMKAQLEKALDELKRLKAAGEKGDR